MISRGIIIGQLIDDLSKLHSQIDLRCQLGLTDLNKYCEDFIKEVLNICYELNLKNLNTERSNEPGIDLGDIKKKIAYQITSTITSDKINKTLEAINLAQLEKYNKIKVFIIGKKQNTYSAVNKDLMTKCSFNISDIEDIADLCRQMISLEYNVLYNLYQLFEKEFQTVIIEIEIPNKDGKYPTSISDKLEVTPNTMCITGNKFIAEYKNQNFKEIKSAFEKLAKLPRITREFLEIIIKIGVKDDGNFIVHYYELKRKLNISEKEINEELYILSEKGFIFQMDEEDLRVRTKFNTILFNIIEFGINNDYLLRLLGAMDFRLLDD